MSKPNDVPYATQTDHRHLRPIPGEKSYASLAGWVGPVCQHYLAGKTVGEIARQTGLESRYVRFIITSASLKSLADKHRKEVMAELLKEKIPLLKEITTLSLLGLRDFLERLITDKERMKRLTTKEARDLSMIAKEQGESLNLELGEATERVEIIRKVEKDVTIILEDLKKEDPFIDYSAPEKKEPSDP